MLMVALLSAALVLPQLATPVMSGCDPNLAAAGLCGQNTGTEIIIDGTQESEAEHESTNPIYDDDWTPPPGWTPPAEVDEFGECLVNWDSYRLCFEALQEAEESDDPASPAMPAITINDLARFAPDGAIITGEPDNVGVVGLPTNFVTTASVQTVAGDLFGFPVSVRFTPAAFDFAFGDGAASTTATGGQSWEELGQAQFTPTDTSHTYSERGTYTASVDVRFSAEVDFGIGWLPISGEVTSAGPPQEIRIFEAHTALVAHTCAQAPNSPGC